MLEIINKTVSDSVKSLFGAIAEFAPKFIMALIVFIIGWSIAKLMVTLFKKIAKTIKLDELSEKIKLKEVMQNVKITTPLSKILSKLIYWVILLIFILISTDVLGVESISKGLQKVLAYLPLLLTASVIFIIGILIATLIKNAIYSATSSIGLSGAKAISNLVYYILFIFITITALNQAGIDTELITSNLTLIFGSALLAFAVAYGIAAKDILSNILSSYYGKDRFKVGQKISINGITGKIEKIDNLSITINTGDKKVIIPSKKLISEQIEVLD